MDEDWRVEVDLEHEGQPLTERLRALDLDDDARKRLGERVTVTRDGPRMYLYATDETQAREAERVVGQLIEADDLSASVTLTRWNPVREEWTDPAVPLPETPEDIEFQHEIAREQNPVDWVIRADVSGLADARRYARALAASGLTVTRNWTHVYIGVPEEKDAEELAAELTPPDGTTVAIERNVEQRPSMFTFFEAYEPEWMRDLGL